MRSAVSIFNYHYIRPPDGHNSFPAVEPSLFRQHLKYIQAHFSPISMPDFISALQGEKKLPQQPAMLTFDDGYLDHYIYVLPLLLEYQIPGTFFIPFDAIINRRLLAVNKIHFILAANVRIDSVIKLLNQLITYYQSQYSLKSPTHYWREFAKPSRFDDASIKYIKNMLQYGLPEPARELILNKIFKQYVPTDETHLAAELYMTVKQIRELKRRGMHLGNHGFSHARLTQLAPAAQKKELQLSLEYFSQLSPYTPNWTMCYPYGEYNQDTIAILRSLHCAAAFTTKGEVTNFKKQGRFALPRLDANDLTVLLHQSRLLQIR